MKAHFTEANLKRIWTAYGCTQAEPAKGSGINLLSIQMHEQHNEGFKKASADMIHSLATLLGVPLEIWLSDNIRSCFWDNPFSRISPN